MLIKCLDFARNPSYCFVIWLIVLCFVWNVGEVFILTLKYCKCNFKYFFWPENFASFRGDLM